MMTKIKTKIMPRRLREVQSVGTAYVDRAMQDLRQLTQHEVEALSGHWSEVNERMAVARRARDMLELVRDQIDLLPETRARLVRDHAHRRTLLRGLVGNLVSRPSKAA
jgi:hypothetical protein